MDLKTGRTSTTRPAVGVEDFPQRLLRLVDRDQAVRPSRVPGRGLGRDGRADEIGNGLGQSPQSRPVDVDAAFVADLLALKVGGGLR